MPEYLSPGVYVEEVETGGRPIGGVSTSVAGFIGLTERGETEGLPELVINFADFQRKLGGYLPESKFGSFRYLPFAVEHFFINGGSRCFVTRVAPSDASAAESGDDLKGIKIWAKNKGSWGNRIQITFKSSIKATSPITPIYTKDGKKFKECRLTKTGGFNAGDIVTVSQGDFKQYSCIKAIKDDFVTLSSELKKKADDNNGESSKMMLSTCDFAMKIQYVKEGSTQEEEYKKLSLNPLSSNYIEKALIRSNLIKAKVDEQQVITVPSSLSEVFAGSSENELTITLGKGSDGTIPELEPDGSIPEMKPDNSETEEPEAEGAETEGTETEEPVQKLTAADFIGSDEVPGKRTGIQAFIDNNDVSILAVPGVVDRTVQLALVSQCEKLKNRFAVLDIPKEAKKVSEVLGHRNIFDSSYAAMYHPWLQVYDKGEKKSIMIPPSGSVAGIYARTDKTRGVHKAPANEGLRETTGLDCQYNAEDQNMLNPEGVNLIRYFTGQGIKVWGARTLSSNTLWKYVNVKRLFIFLEESIKRGAQWVVFEPNDEKLWARVNRTITSFLTTVWREGALAGATPAEAFFIKIDRSTMSQDDIDNGRLICEIGVSPVKPAEFVIFRISQNTGNAG
ncbi:MAG: phage tail sheath subtilisin-like domain-containing protein [Clostridia bacterium]|nr:phage tail sheath subtilisin-like domain-containing protein [Clostridia bacterium]